MAVVGFIAGLGLPELLVVLVLVLILFGAGRLPQVFESFGKGIRAFRDAQNDTSKDDDGAIELEDQQSLKSGQKISEAEEVTTKS